MKPDNDKTQKVYYSRKCKTRKYVRYKLETNMES